jgi:hypothetical protein
MSDPSSKPHSAEVAMPGRVVTATFPSRAAAERVCSELECMGISPDNVRLVEEAPNPASVTLPRDTGWDALADSVPRDETALEQEKGIAPSPCVLGAEVDIGRAEAVMKLLKDQGGLEVRSSTRR